MTGRKPVFAQFSAASFIRISNVLGGSELAMNVVNLRFLSRDPQEFTEEQMAVFKEAATLLAEKYNLEKGIDACPPSRTTGKSPEPSPPPRKPLLRLKSRKPSV